LEASWDIDVSNSKNSNHKREKEDQNAVEKQEDSQIVDDVGQHRHNWTQSVKNSQKEECLDETQKQNDHHQALGHQRKWASRILKDNISDRCPDVEHINVVPIVLKVLC
tara:strand:+ start:582 stop:908 length:327 start_codon:yes stop_codon:yes gene_type:complete